MSNPKRPVSTVEEFIKVFHEMSARYGRSELWYDYIDMHAIALANTCDLRCRDAREEQYNTECLNLAKSIDAIMLCYNPDIDALKAENLSDMAVRLLDGVSRRDVVKDLEDFRDKRRHYNEQAAAESQVILDKISELFEKDGDSK